MRAASFFLVHFWYKLLYKQNFKRRINQPASVQIDGKSFYRKTLTLVSKGLTKHVFPTLNQRVVGSNPPSPINIKPCKLSTYEASFLDTPRLKYGFWYNFWYKKTKTHFKMEAEEV